MHRVELNQRARSSVALADLLPRFVAKSALTFVIADLEGDAMVALTQTEFGDWLKCFLVLGGGGDRLLDVKWLQAAPPESERGPRSEQEVTSDLDGFLGRFSKEGGFSGAVLGCPAR
jgi:hypothetical protein